MKLEKSLETMGEFGSLTEPLLAKALSLITGVSTSSSARTSSLETMPLNEIDHSKKPHNTKGKNVFR